MKNKNINDLLELMNSLDFATDKPRLPSDRVVINNIPTLTDIENTEKQLNIKLPQSYIDFNTKSPWYWFELACSYIVKPINHSKNFVYGTICELNKNVREKEFYKYWNEDEEVAYYDERIPDFLIVFESQAAIDGDYLCLDTRFPKDYPIVYWSIEEDLYEKYDEKNTKLKNVIDFEHPYFLYPNFSTFMYYRIKDCLEHERLWGYKNDKNT